jgi:hypothetical protein
MTEDSDKCHYCIQFSAQPKETVLLGEWRTHGCWVGGFHTFLAWGLLGDECPLA